jgi:hypothetical protein
VAGTVLYGKTMIGQEEQHDTYHLPHMKELKMDDYPLGDGVDGSVYGGRVDIIMGWSQCLNSRYTIGTLNGTHSTYFSVWPWLFDGASHTAELLVLDEI